MKYGKQWQRDVQKLPEELQDQCIDYRSWKKVAKQSQSHDAMVARLSSDMLRVESVFMSPPRSRFMCCRAISNRSSTPSKDTHAMYAFAMVNKACIVKIIKRCDKRSGSHLRDWYNAHKHEYSFCGGVKLTRLALECGMHQVEECPICLDPPNTGVILECGHIICLDCIKDMYHIRHMRGTISNLISTSIYMNKHSPCCPLCRCQKPLHRVSSNQIISL